MLSERNPNHRSSRVIARLLRAKNHSRMAHGWIFTGDHLDSLNDLARRWIETLVCLQPSATQEPCHACANCRALRIGAYPSLYELKPRSKSRQIRIDDVREVERALHLTSGALQKIAWIQEAERMGEEAQNAFLKTLEEPPPQSHLVLTTTAPEQLLPTIRSRCQIVSLCNNRCEYRDDDVQHLADILAPVSSGAGPVAAGKAAERLVTMLATARKCAEEDAKGEGNGEGSPANSAYARIMSAEEREAAATAVYLRRREEMLGIIYSWFAQNYMRACGIPAEMLPAPRLVSNASTTGRSSGIAARMNAEKELGAATNLIESLRFNIDETLAVQSFCQTVCH